jgi:peroxiredoxin
MAVLPRTRAPELAFDLVGGGRFRLADRAPREFTLVVVYRGKHCPLCRKQLEEFAELLPEFTAAGIEVVAVSANDRELAEATVAEWALGDLPVGFGLDLATARRFGLFLSAAVKDSEPDHFVEPGLFVVRPDGTVYAAVVQTMPFSRPPARALLSSLTWIAENGYPARGEATYEG